jgi:hypothetical protein
MTRLPYTFWFWHLTETGDLKWRQGDWDTRSIVKGLKEEPFKGRFEITIKGVRRTYTTANIEQFVAILMPFLGRKLREEIDGKISIVPVPNSGMALGVKGTFRCVELAQMVANGFGDDATVVPAIRWDEPREKAHKNKGYRHPDQFEPHMRLVKNPSDQVVLFDDVVTSGSQMIAAARFLTDKGFPPVRGLAVAHATKVQNDHPFLHKQEDELVLDREVFDFDDDL